MNKEEKEKIVAIVAPLIAEQANKIAEKTSNKWVSYIFRFIGTLGLLLSGANMLF